MIITYISSNYGKRIIVIYDIFIYLQDMWDLLRPEDLKPHQLRPQDQGHLYPHEILKMTEEGDAVLAYPHEMKMTENGDGVPVYRDAIIVDNDYDEPAPPYNGKVDQTVRL